MYKTYIETKHENHDRLGLSEISLAGYLLTHPRKSKRIISILSVVDKPDFFITRYAVKCF